jgi:hypothetical protein
MSEAKSKKDQIIARARTAKASTKARAHPQVPHSLKCHLDLTCLATSNALPPSSSRPLTPPTPLTPYTHLRHPSLEHHLVPVSVHTPRPHPREVNNMLPSVGSAPQPPVPLPNPPSNPRNPHPSLPTR